MQHLKRFGTIALLVTYCVGIATGMIGIGIRLHDICSNQESEPIIIDYVISENVEEEVLGVDYDTDFVPGFYYISPEDEYYETLELMARCVEAEAGNQGLEGKRMVVDVILNRVDHPAPYFPDTVRGVITQENAFSTYWNGAMDKVVPTEETWDAINMELKERSYPSILYFSCEGYLPYGTPWRKVGGHYFSIE